MLLFNNSAYAQWHNLAEDIMGTRVSVELWHKDQLQADQAMAAVMAVMHQVNASMSPYLESSELYQLNAHAAQTPVVVSADLFSLLQKSLYYSKISDGKFDISFASVGRFYNYRKSLAPSERERLDNLPAINYRQIQLNSAQSSVRFLHPQLKIDLGGIAKGYAVDRAIALLEQRGIASAIVSAGGDSRILGDRRGTPWVMGIRHPRKAEQYAVRIPLINSAISTSGDYERFFIKDEQRVHHIINPATGKSVSSVQSVSILAPLAVDSDALSTTVFVLGIEQGLALVNNMPGIDAIIIAADGRLHYSDELLRAQP
ncbi:FAD:protein FMN transferase [Oceanicoccus sagamiensis]|uniref:FAD:protein FMN transferase n=1 Tax=Oceanicoccus sagamiensis TaxID=716816 RepID=UPI001F0B3C0C|nr:FAD:protein FMN transferase [Oceanicoccus sagamiensis]